jgi:hypothetical protein
MCISFVFCVGFFLFLEHRCRRRFCDGRNLQKRKKIKNKKIIQLYTYDLRTTLTVRGAGGCLIAKKGTWCEAVLVRCGAVFVDLFHFLLLFVTFFTVRNFYKLLFTVETGVKFVTFCYFFYCL